MSFNRTQTVFNATASTYDTDRSKLIPGCDAFYRWAIDLVPVRAKTILDLGAGSGLLTQSGVTTNTVFGVTEAVTNGSIAYLSLVNNYATGGPFFVTTTVARLAGSIPSAPSAARTTGAEVEVPVSTRQGRLDRIR